MDRPVTDRMTSLARAVVPWRSIAAVALLSMLLVVALSGGLSGERSSLLPSAHAGASSRKGLTSLPLPAQGPVSAALGADDPAYRVSAWSGGFSAVSPAQRLRERFGRTGVHLSSGAIQLAVGLRAVGYGSSLQPVGSVTPRATANRVLYPHAGLSEWYANGPLGVEQGFTLPRAPSGDPAEPLTLSLALAGNAHVTLASGGLSITLSHPGAATLRYGALSATDARGRTLHSWLELHAGRVLIDVDTRGARYPLRIDPLIQQGPKLVGGDEESDEGHFGFSVALSADGNTALVGAPTANGEAGAVWVFTRSKAGAWTQPGEKLTGSGEVGSGEVGKGLFGSSVALSAEGNTAVIGGPGDNGGVGAAWVFTRLESGAWTQQEKLTGSGETGNGEFGFSVALAPSEKGEDALIGGPGNEERTGAAWVFVREEKETTWAKQALITGEEATAKEAEFGYSVALSPKEGTKEGDLALIGGPRNKAGAGAAWVYLRKEKETTWGYQATLTGEEATVHAEFGKSVAISAEGTYALVGGPGNKENAGAAWVLTRSGTTWTYQATLTPKEKEESEMGAFGSRVALSSDGDTALIGGPSDNEDTGAAWMFARSSEEAWAPGEKLLAEEGAESEKGAFGSSVALSSDGYTALIGGPADNTNIGAAWAFVNPPTVTNVTPNAGPTAGETSVTITGTNLNEAAAVQFGTSSAIEFTVNSATSITAVAPAGASTVHVSVTTSGGTSETSPADEFTYVPVPTVVAEPASPFAQTTATLNATVNPNGGEVSECKFEYGTASYEKTVSCTPAKPGGSGTSAAAATASLSGLAANTTYKYRISATNTGGSSHAESTFKTLPDAPTVVAEPASPVAQTTATLNATVNPNGGSVSECKIEYGTNTEYKSGAATCTPSPGSGESAVTVSAEVTGLTANTTYHFRITATNAGGTSKGSDETFKTLPNAPTVETKAASSLTQTSATLNAAVNPNGGNVSECKLEYGTSSTPYTSSVSCSPSPGSGEIAKAVTGAAEPLKANTTYHFRVVASNPGGKSVGADQTFETLPDAPTVLTGAASSVAKTSAMLNASVNPNGGEVSECKLEYGTSSTPYTSSVSCSPSPGSGEIANAVTGAAEPLKANTTYHFRVVASNPGGKSVGADQTFETLPDAPTVLTGAASSITKTSAMLNAKVNPSGGEVTECKFEYGTNTEYKSTPVSCASPPGNGSSAVSVSAAIGSLTANTTYHFRISATNAGGTSKGSDETFKTLPNAPTVVTKAASSITQTTATLNATVNPNGGEATECKLEYGETTSYAKTASCAALPGAGESAVAVTAALTGLTANTTYHFRIVATNSGGTSEGADQTFKTLPNPPTVVTKAASSLTQTGATLNATVDPNGGEVSDCKLEYGPTTSYGSSASCAPPPGSGSSAVGVSGAAEALQANTTYHFRVVAVNAGGTSKGSDETFKTLPDQPTVETKAASAVAQTTATLNASVNPNGGEVSKCEFEYGETVSYGKIVSCAALPGSGSSEVAVSAAVTGLAANTTYHFRVVAVNAGGTSKGSDETLKTLPNAPTVVTGTASSTQTTATLNATVNPNGGNVSECKLEYGTTNTYGSSASCSPSPGSGTSAVAVSASITGLTANTTYHFRISATNAGGTSKGSDETFKTLPNPPTVVTKAATSVAQTTATLNATVNPNGGEVSSCKFEYGTSEAYGATVPCTPSSPGSGNGAVAVSASVVGLSANTTYHFRISATNAGGAGTGSDGTFKTLPNAPTVETKAASSLTQISATLNATVNPNGGNVSECKLEYGEKTSYGASAPCTPSPGSGNSTVTVSAAVTGLIKNTTYHFRIVATNTGGTSSGADQTFETAPGPPTIEMQAPTAIGQTSAILHASLNPNGGVITQCYFHYERVVPALGEIPVITPCVGLPISGKKPMPVSALAGAEEGLSAATSYHFSIEVINSFDETAFSPLPESEPPQFKTLPGPEVVTGAASSVTQTSATLNATVNPNGGEVSNCHFEYGATASYGSSATCTPSPGAGTSPVAVSAQVHGLSVNTPYYFRIVATNPGGESKDTLGQKFTTSPNPPVVVTAAASSPTQTSATLNGTVNPNGGTVSDCHFEYGTSTSYGSSVSCSSLPGLGESPVAVSAALGGLSANTTYHFRIVATNAGGPSLPGADQTFTTPPNAPTVVTEQASSITQTAAMLNAIVDPNGGSVSDCKLEYGSSASYGSSVSCTPSPGSGNSAVAVSASLGSLSANTTYHFRIVATNPGGVHSGSDQSFTTAPVPPPATPPKETTFTTTKTKTGTTTTSVTSDTPGCRVSLASTSVMAQTGGMAAIKLSWTGTATGTCSGKLTLTVKAKGKSKRSKPTLIGTGAFSIPPGKTQIVRLKLNGAGRALLEAGHGHLSANLAILELFPDPSQAQTETVHLAREARVSSKGKK
jgi:phosphodiesterase/alkaline phosphatase D-like protein